MTWADIFRGTDAATQADARGEVPLPDPTIWDTMDRLWVLVDELQAFVQSGKSWPANDNHSQRPARALR